jgi:hypothetical protein
MEHLITSGLFDVWIDPVSRVQSHILRRLAAPLQQSFYFTQPCWSRDGRYLWFYGAFPPSGDSRNGRILGVADLDAGTVTALPETQFTDGSPWIDPDDGTAVWATRNGVWQRGPRDRDSPVRLARISDSLLRKRPVQRLATHLTRSADRAWFLLDITVGSDRLLGGVPSEGGELEIWQRFDRPHHHAQFSPTDPDMILLAEEEDLDARTGDTRPPRDRILVSRREGPPQSLGLGPKVGHEWWHSSGKAIWYIDFGRGTMCIDLADPMPTCIWPAGNWHANSSRCGRFLVADTRRLDARRCQYWSVLFHNRDTGRSVDIVTGMALPDSSLETYHVHPHPSFQCEDRMIVYTTRVAGGADVAVASIADLIAATSE